MAIMLVTRTLRDSDGNSLGVSAPAGTKVLVLDQAPAPPLIKIKLPDLPGQPEGFVSFAAVDTAANATLGPLDKALFAKQCADQEAIYGVSAHYLMAVAALRTNVTDGPSPGGSGDTGPFALSPSEWKFFTSMPDFQFGFVDSDINFWRFQCAVFAVMTYVTQNKLAGLLGNQPTATELYFSQLAGTSAAITGLRSPAQLVDDLIKSVSRADFESDGIDSGRIIARSAGLLKNSVSTKDTLDLIAAKLEKALGDTRQFLVEVGAQPIPDPVKPLPNFPTDPGTSGGTLFQAKAPAIMDKLMDDFKFSKLQAAGVLGNIGEECNGFTQFQEVHPKSGRGGFGWCQWTADRRVNFEKFCQDHHVSTISDEGNYGFLQLELKTSKKAVVPHLKATSNLEDAVGIFESEFEIAGVAALPLRLKFAQKALDAHRQRIA